MRIPALTLLLSLLLVAVGCNRDARDYARAQKANTYEAYEEFVRTHPASKFIEPAKAQAEELLFQFAGSQNTIADYRAFLKKYPQSRHAAQVTERMRQLAPLKAEASSELRGWTSEGKLLVVVTVPLPSRPTVDLYRYELRADGKPLGQCVGIVPPEKFKGGVTGMISEVRDNNPLSVAGLRPAKTVKNATGIANLNVQGSFRPLAVENALVVGQRLTMGRAGAGSFALADPSITYLLQGSGFRFATEFRDTRQSGFLVPLKEKISLLFVVAPPVAPLVELVNDQGFSTDAAIETR
jgi:hypothetical protein